MAPQSESDKNMDIINLSNFKLEDRHIQLLRRGLSFSPTR